MAFDAGEVVIVPFPFTDLGRTKPRPALVLSAASDNEASGAAILAMITTAAKSTWPTDTPLKDLDTAGLAAPCVVRPKLFTLDQRLISRSIGALSSRDRAAVRKVILKLIAI